MDLLTIAEQSFVNENVANFPEFKAGDTITVAVRIREGDKVRLQDFRGVVIQISGATPLTRTFTVKGFRRNRSRKDFPSILRQLTALP